MEGRSSDLNQYKFKKSIRLSIHYLIAIQNLNFVNMAMTPMYFRAYKISSRLSFLHTYFMYRISLNKVRGH